MKRPGPYACFDVGMFEDELFANLGAKSQLTFIKLCCYAASERTDGRIPTALIPQLLAAAGATRRALNQLIECGLVQKLPITDGYYLPAYLKWNPSREELERNRENWKRRQAEKRVRERGENIVQLRP